MAKFHVNAKGEAGQCSAKISCPFGGDAQHYASPEIAQKAFELSMASQSLPEPAKRSTEPKVKTPTSGAYDVGSKAERYVHPQGKVVEINPNGTVTAWKNGKIIPTSATAEKLRKGHGAWKKADPNSGEPKPYMGPPATPVRAPASILKKDAEARKSFIQSPPPILTPEEQDNQERVSTLIAKGYPKTSDLDPRKKPKMQERAPEVDKFRGGFRGGRPVLPTGTRINPHQKPEDNEFVDGWNKYNQGSIIAVVKQQGESRDVYRSLLSGHDGESHDILGDSFTLEHDQTFAKIGQGNWTVVGVYEPQPGGAVIGEIPNQKIPFYVYK